MPGIALSVEDRDEIAAALAVDPMMSWASIGRRVSRDPTTIAREVMRNEGRDKYRPAAAQRRCTEQRQRPKLRLLSVASPIRDRIVAELIGARSPYAIRADLVAEGISCPCVESMYSSIYDNTLGVDPKQCLRTKRARRHPHRPTRNCRLPGPLIALRPACVADRVEPGHWEADLIIGAKNGSGMLSIAERVTRYSRIFTMPDGYKAPETLAALNAAFEQIPKHLRLSLTLDQGGEWSLWEQLAEHFSMDIWFCNSHSPWERGQVENANRQWRFWFPRGTDLSIVTPQQADHATNLINNQRRRLLNNNTPQQLYNQLILH